MSLTQDEEIELLALLEAEEETADLPPWLAQVTPTWTWTWAYQRLILTHLDSLTRGEINRLMLFLPPRHGKSELATIRYPVWRVEREPGCRVIVGAYNQRLAESFSRSARRIAQRRFRLSEERRAASEWQTATGGGYRAVGVGAGVTGHGGDLIIIDDPVKSREEAESETYRDRVWEWYTQDLYTRLEPGGQMVLIQTRWHEDDLAGRILASEDAPNWTVLSLPALAEEGDPLARDVGEALCPDRFDVEALEDRRRVLGSYAFTALYQQRPAPPEGARFRRSWFRYFRVCADAPDYYELSKPDGTRELVKRAECWRFMTIDPAATENKTSDYFVASTWAVTPKRDLLLLNVFRERAETTKHEGILQPIIQEYKPRQIGVEKVTFGLNIIQRLRVLGLPVVELKADKDKISRSLPIQARYEGGGVYHLEGASWLAECEEQLLHFPVGTHDDFVDTASYAGIQIAGYGPYAPVPPEPDLPQGRSRAVIRAREKAYARGARTKGSEEY